MKSEPYAPSNAPYAVWEQTSTGRYLHLFHDEFLAMQFAVSVSSQVIDNPIEH
jgi:hypothetical protein